MKALSVVIPSRTASNLVPCVEAVRKHEPEARIIVVWDAPKTGDPFVRDLWDVQNAIGGMDSGAMVIRGESPFIFARNVNIGIRASGEESDVCILNDDAILETPGGFSIMQAAAEQNLEVGIIGAVTDLTGQPLQRRQRNLLVEEQARHVPEMGLRAVEHFAFVAVLIPARTRKFLDNWHESHCMKPHGGTCSCSARNANGGFLDEDFCVDYGVEDRSFSYWVRHTALLCCVHDGCFVNHSSLHSSFRGNPEAPGSFQENLKIFKRKWNLSQV